MERPCRSFLIWGAGGYGRVGGDLVRYLGHELTGFFVDHDPEKLGSIVEPLGSSCSARTWSSIWTHIS